MSRKFCYFRVNPVENLTKCMKERSPHALLTKNASPLEIANEFLQTMYTTSRGAILQETRSWPLIIAYGSYMISISNRTLGGNLTLRIGEYRESVVSAAENYTYRKLISHTVQ